MGNGSITSKTPRSFLHGKGRGAIRNTDDCAPIRNKKIEEIGLILVTFLN